MHYRSRMTVERGGGGDLEDFGGAQVPADGSPVDFERSRKSDEKWEASAITTSPPIRR